MTKPDFCTDKMVEYLESLGTMGGHIVSLKKRFPELSQHQAAQVVIYWISTWT